MFPLVILYPSIAQLCKRRDCRSVWVFCVITADAVDIPQMELANPSDERKVINSWFIRQENVRVILEDKS